MIFYHLFSGQGVPGVPKIKENYNPATWMLEVTSPSAESKLELDFASFYKESNLCRYKSQSSEVKRHSAQVLYQLKSKSLCLMRGGDSKEYNNKALASNLPHQHLLHQTKSHYVHFSMQRKHRTSKNTKLSSTRFKRAAFFYSLSTKWMATIQCMHLEATSDLLEKS